MLSNSTLLSICNSFASIVDAAINVFGTLLSDFGLSSVANALPKAATLCSSVFG